MLISNKKMLLSIAISSSLFSISYAANANDHDHHDHGSEHRQHGAHVHGVIETNIAQDGEHLLFEITAPGADVVGFEHAPKNEEQKQVLSQAVKTLNNPTMIFTLQKDAKCTLEEVHVSHNLTDDNHDHDHDHDHDQHDGEHHKEHSKHGEFNAQYEYHCEAISQLNEIETQWFKHFTHSQKMTVQYLGDSGQKATTLTADVPTVNL
ncbi:DUF2796 domain-containing protein [Aliivibrio logei]|uniref:zinc uptake protein ZrgA n=1 Tax=Aliivibrio logei TaxID=688 RepID=UPI0035C8F124